MTIAARPEVPAEYEWPGRYGRHHGLWHAGPALIGMAVLGFIFCWPLGIAALALMIWGAKMGCGFHHGEEHWGGRWQERMAARRERWERRVAEHRARHRPYYSGNRAFEAYRAETLHRLEDEEREFRNFLDRLRFAKDKAEFDEFLANRRPPSSPSEPEAPTPS